ncbi:intracellular short-chain-length polyhydroxyalkanoate depolymerase [Halococcus sediminicola]|uniref:intracellular short-chain-length polyhydroxyalkanoate depolymerase n=1 Tax=Halococcus sediminicola TaxID=1264579 RepID=UPI000B222FDE|nr:alpha/beta hydrolase [Halococcus sediminicola]
MSTDDMTAELHSTELPNGETISYREREGGTIPLLLLHGNQTSSKHWDVLLEAMDPEYKLYAMDMRGFGASSYETQIDSIANFANDVEMFVDELDLEAFHLMGWSTGGGVAMEFAADHPDRVRKLVLMAPVSTRGYPIYRKDENGEPTDEFLTTREEIAEDPIQVMPVAEAQRTNDGATMRAIWEQLIYTHNQPEPARYDEYVEDMLTQRNIVDVDYALAQFNISEEDNGVTEGTGKATEIDMPTLVLRGERDLVITEEMVKQTVADIGANAELLVLDDCGHSPLIDDLDQLLYEVTTFIES